MRTRDSFARAPCGRPDWVTSHTGASLHVMTPLSWGLSNISALWCCWTWIPGLWLYFPYPSKYLPYPSPHLVPLSRLRWPFFLPFSGHIKLSFIDHLTGRFPSSAAGFDHYLWLPLPPSVAASPLQDWTLRIEFIALLAPDPYHVLLSLRLVYLHNFALLFFTLLPLLFLPLSSSPPFFFSVSTLSSPLLPTPFSPPFLPFWIPLPFPRVRTERELTVLLQPRGNFYWHSYLGWARSQVISTALPSPTYVSVFLIELFIFTLNVNYLSKPIADFPWRSGIETAKLVEICHLCTVIPMWSSPLGDHYTGDPSRLFPM